MSDANRAAAEAIFAEPPNIHVLRERFPEAWEVVYAELQAAAANPTPPELARRLTDASADWKRHAGLEARVLGDASGALALAAATSRLRVLSLDQLCRALVDAAAPPSKLGALDALLWRPMVRRAARASHARPLALHQARWGRLRNKPAAAVDLYRRGVFCIYPRELVARLAERLGPRPTLELGAGSGLLARYLAEAGVDITAVDDFSWAGKVAIGANVLRQDAASALAARQPRAVICSWPPPGNRFEAHVFLTRSVELYVVLLSRHVHASGDWAAYARQRAFDCAVASDLAALVHPAEVEATVLVFTRKPAPAKGRGRGG